MHVQGDYKYDVYISYNKADLRFARRLAGRIERQHIKGDLIKVFFDEWDIEPGENILLKIEEAEPSSRFIVLIMSPEWLKSNWTTLERVIPVYDDPSGLKGRIIPIMRRKCEPPPSIRILKWLDFTTNSNFERELAKLIARIKGQTTRELMAKRPLAPPSLAIFSSASMTADVQDEELTSNIFPVLQIPFDIHVANAKVKRRQDVWRLLGENIELPPFALDEDECKIFSFANLQNPQYRFGELFLEPSTETIRTEDVIVGRYSSIVIELLNRAMTFYMQNEINMTYDWKNTKKTFFKLEKKEDQTRLAHWKIGKAEYTRFLVKRVSTKNPYYVHRSCKATFTIIDKWPYLKVQPGWHFTQDGMNASVSSSRMSSLSSRWMNRQRNHSVLDEVRYWIYLLSKGSHRIDLSLGGDINATIAAMPVFSTVNRGIEGDYRKRLWYESPTADYSERIAQKIMKSEGKEIEETEGNAL